jgi:hypothetical protein
MATTTQDRSRLAEATLLRQIMEGPARDTGEAFFRSLVQNLAQALGTFGAWVTDYLPEARRLRARAFWLGKRWIDQYEYDIAGTPCEAVVEQCRLLHIPDRVVELFPGDPDLKTFGAVSYTGMPFTDAAGRIVGHLAVLDTKPLPETSGYLAIFRISQRAREPSCVAWRPRRRCASARRAWGSWSMARSTASSTSTRDCASG